MIIPMTGEELRQALNNPPPKREYLIDEFLATRSIIMLTGERGKGKSIVATQLSLSLTSGTPLFGQLTIPKPCRVYYLQTEGDREDHFERIRLMEQTIPLNIHNLYWDQDNMFHLKDPQLVKKKLALIKSIWPELPDLIIIDPIYKIVFDDLAKAEPALMLVRFSTILYQEFKCSILLINHPPKDMYDHGQKVSDDALYYGHSFLQNHMTTCWRFKQTNPQGAYSQLILTKSNFEREVPFLDLAYHPETSSCSMEASPLGLTKVELVKEFLLRCHKINHTTDFHEVKLACKLSTAHLRRIQVELIASNLLELQPTPGKKTIWIPKLNEVSH